MEPGVERPGGGRVRPVLVAWRLGANNRGYTTLLPAAFQWSMNTSFSSRPNRSPAVTSQASENVHVADPKAARLRVSCLNIVPRRSHTASLHGATPRHSGGGNVRLAPVPITLSWSKPVSCRYANIPAADRARDTQLLADGLVDLLLPAVEDILRQRLHRDEHFVIPLLAGADGGHHVVGRASGPATANRRHPSTTGIRATRLAPAFREPLAKPTLRPAAEPAAPSTPAEEPPRVVDEERLDGRRRPRPSPAGPG